MSIRKKGPYWHYRIWIRGKEHTGTTGYRATPEFRGLAELREQRRRAELRSAILGEQKEVACIPISIQEAIPIYLAWAAGEYSRPSSYKRIATSLRAVRPILGRLQVCLVGAAELERLKSIRRQAGCKPVTIRHDLHALSTFFRFAIGQGWAKRNPVRLIRIPSDADAVRIRVLSLQEETTYLEVARQHRQLHDLAVLMLRVGLRPSEVLALRAGDVDLERQTLTVRQGKTAAARRTLRLVGDAFEVIGRRGADKDREDFLFPGADRDRPRSQLNMVHTRALRRAGLRFCLYDLRHTFASRMAERGMPLTTLAAILGHSGLRCVTRYVHPSQAVMDEAMERFG